MNIIFNKGGGFTIEQTTQFCRSVFKGEDNAISKEQFTKMWIILINQLEKNKKNIK